MNRFIISLLLLLPALIIQAGNGFIEVENPGDWEVVLQKAKSQNKLVLVDMYTDWCGYCKMMDRDVFSDKEYQEELASQYIPVKIDGDSGFGKKFVADYKVQGFPTFIFFDANAQVLDRVEGYSDLKAFRKTSSRIFDRSTNRKKLEKRYAKGKLNNEELAHYYTLIDDSNEKEKIEKQLFEDLDDAALLSGPYDAFLFASSTDLDQRGCKLILTNNSLLSERNGAIVYEQFIETLFNKTMDEVTKSGDQKLLVQLETELLPAYVNDEAALPQAKLILRKLYHGNRGEWTDYERMVQEQWTKYPDPGQYYNEAYALLDTYMEDPEAMSLAESWLQLGITKDDNFQSNMLLAVVQLMQGKQALGKQSLEKADSLAKTDEEKAQIQELLRMAGEG